MRKILMSWLTAPLEDPFEMLRIAAAAGYDGIGLRLCDPLTGEASSALVTDPHMRRAFAAALQQAGMVVNEIEARILTAGRGQLVAPEVFAAATELGHPLLVAVADQAGAITQDALCDRFATLAREAAVHDIPVGFEPIAHRACGTLDASLQIVSGHKGATLVLDALHLHRMGVTATRLASVDPSLLRVFHLCDAPEIPVDLAGQIDHSAFNRLWPGEGVLPLADYIAALPANLPVSLEIPTQRLDGIIPWQDRASAALAAARNLLALTSGEGSRNAG